MSTQVQFRRGTAAQHNSFVGAPGEITVDTTNNNLRVHDGVTPGGHPLTLQSLFNAHLAEDVLDGVHGMGRIASQDYEQGNWTPQIIGTISGSALLDSELTVGSYVRAGNLVYLNLHIALTSKNGIAGSVRISGLPFVIQGISPSDNPVAVFSSYLNATPPSGAIQLVNRSLRGTSNIDLRWQKSDATIADVSVNDISDTFLIRGQMVYKI